MSTFANPRGLSAADIQMLAAFSVARPLSEVLANDERDLEQTLFTKWALAYNLSWKLEPGMFCSHSGWLEANAAANDLWERVRECQGQMKVDKQVFTGDMVSYQWFLSREWERATVDFNW